jgi:hypothetical protein
MTFCNYQNKGCGCQFYLEDTDHPEKCLYCGHYNAFHSGFIPEESSNFGVCQKDFAHCGCQAFVASSDNESKCKYCNHFNAFHKQKSNINSNITNITQPNNALSLLSQMPTASTISTSSSAVSNRQFLTPREEILANFRPQHTTPLFLNPRNSRRHNNNRVALSRGRPKIASLQLNHVFLFTNNWKEMQPPRENSIIWNRMMENGHIATNVSFNENTSIAINEVISEVFSLATEIKWIILNGSLSRLRIATSQVRLLNTYICHNIIEQNLIIFIL